MVDRMDRDKFYSDAEKYWSGIPSTVNGMLGGYGHISSTDIAGSTRFLKEFLQPRGKVGKAKALDCGAGIGRITKRLLLPTFQQVDMAELSQDFLNEAENKYLGDEAKRIGSFFCTGLEQFTPKEGYYDVIWCQWVLGQLKDDDLVQFFKRCQKGLAPNGMVFLKENINKGHSADFDEDDSSYCRPRDALIELIKQSGLKIIKEERQNNFPKELYDVRMFALE